MEYFICKGEILNLIFRNKEVGEALDMMFEIGGKI
jgi:hypothetical protein